MSENFDPIQIAAIHTTILAVFIAVSAAYFHHISAEIEDAKFKAFQGIKDVNHVRLINDESLYKESVTAENTEIPQLIKQLHLVINDTSGHVSERGHKALHILTILGNTYPFRKRLEYNGDGPTEEIGVDNLDEAKQWMEAAEKILRRLPFYIYSSYQRKRLETVLDAHYKERRLKHEEARKRRIKQHQIDMKGVIDQAPEEDRDRVRKELEEYIKGFEEHFEPADRRTAEEASRDLVNDLILGLSRLQGIYDSVSSQLQRIEYYNHSIPSKSTQRFLLVSACIFLFFIVPVPICFQQCMPQLVIKISSFLPFLYYITMFFLGIRFFKVVL